MDDLKTLQPTVFPVVPRLLNRMFDKVRVHCLYSRTCLVHEMRRVDRRSDRSSSPQVFSQANTPLKRWLLDFAFRRKETELKNGVVRKDSMWDKLIFKKVQVDGTRVSSLLIGGFKAVSAVTTYFLCDLRSAGESGRSGETHDHGSGSGFSHHPDVPASCSGLSGEPQPQTPRRSVTFNERLRFRHQ